MEWKRGILDGRDVADGGNSTKRRRERVGRATEEVEVEREIDDPRNAVMKTKEEVKRGLASNAGSRATNRNGN